MDTHGLFEELFGIVRQLGDELGLVVSYATKPPVGNFSEQKEEWVSRFERDYIVSLLRRNQGNISHAAKEADIDRKYFRKLMRKYEITVDEST